MRGFILFCCQRRFISGYGWFFNIRHQAGTIGEEAVVSVPGQRRRCFYEQV